MIVKKKKLRGPTLRASVVYKGLQYGCSQRGTEKIIHFTRQSLVLHPDRDHFFMDAFNQVSRLKVNCVYCVYCVYCAVDNMNTDDATIDILADDDDDDDTNTIVDDMDTDAIFTCTYTWTRPEGERETLLDPGA